MFNKHYGKTMILRLLALLLAAALCAGAAGAEASDPFFAQFENITWTFASGAGGWSTDLWILPDGTFCGEFHDSEMGELADEYPDGTVYLCSFNGRLSFTEQADENTWKIRVDKLFLFFRPDTPMDRLTGEMQFWTHLFDDMDHPADELQNWFMYSEANDSGFVGLSNGGAGVSLANPWEDLTAEQLREVTGRSVTLPEGAENAVYRWNGMDCLAEVQFSWMNGEYCFRSQPASPAGGHLADISGMYFTWEHEESVTVGGCPGSIAQAQSGAGDWVERCLWYDEAAEITYSLSVAAADLDGLDLAAVAEQLCLPAEG